MTPGSKTSIQKWAAEVQEPSWTNYSDVKQSFGSADFVGNGRVVFNIKRNQIRIVALMIFRVRTVYIRFIGTHAEYDQIQTFKLYNLMKPIRNEAEHQIALQRVEAIWNAGEGSAELDELEVLVTLIEKYESIHYPIFEDADAIEVIKQTIEDKGMKNKDLLSVFGSESAISNVLSRRRQLTLKMVKDLHRLLGIPLQLLVA